MTTSEPRVAPRVEQGIALATLLASALLALPLGVVLASLPWTQDLAPWALPAALASGVGIALTLALLPGTPMSVRTVHNPRRLRFSRYDVTPALAALTGALIAEVAAPAGGIAGGGLSMGALLFAITAALLGATPVSQTAQGRGWLAVLPAALATVLVWRSPHPTLTQAVALFFLVLLSTLVVGLAALGGRLAHWRLQGYTFERSAEAARVTKAARGPVASSLPRVGCMAIVCALLAAAPAADTLVALARLTLAPPPILHHPSTQALSVVIPPVTVVPGAPLPLSAPAATGDEPLLTYTVSHIGNLGDSRSATIGLIPPLFITSLDGYAGGRWTSSDTAIAGHALGVRPALPIPATANADLLTADIHLLLPREARAPDGAATLLPGFDQPTSYSVDAQVGALSAPTSSATSSATNPRAVDITDWRFPDPLPAGGLSYTVTSMLPAVEDVPHDLPHSAADAPLAYGWDGATYARLTEVPPAIAAELAPLVRGWIVGTSGWLAAEDAIDAALRTRMQLDSGHVEPEGDAAVLDFLRTRRGNALVWTTIAIFALRLLGYPTRLAEGYLPGAFDLTYGLSVVRPSDATVWAQIAIPEVGWWSVYPSARESTTYAFHRVLARGAPAQNQQGKTGKTPNTPRRPQSGGSTGGPPGKPVSPTSEPHTAPPATPPGGALAQALAGLGALLAASCLPFLLLVLLLALVIGVLVASDRRRRRASRALVTAAFLRLHLALVWALASASGVARLIPGDTPFVASARVGAGLRRAGAGGGSRGRGASERGEHAAAAVAGLTAAYVRLRYGEGSLLVDAPTTTRGAALRAASTIRRILVCRLARSPRALLRYVIWTALRASGAAVAITLAWARARVRRQHHRAAGGLSQEI